MGHHDLMRKQNNRECQIQMKSPFSQRSHGMIKTTMAEQYEFERRTVMGNNSPYHNQDSWSRMGFQEVEHATPLNQTHELV